MQQADYEIDMYGEADDYIGTFGGSTSDGTISFLWDLTDPIGNQRTDMKFTGQFFVAAAGQPLPATPSGTRTWNGEPPWNDGGFVVAWAALNGNQTLTSKLDQMVTDGVVNVLDGSYTMNSGNTPHANAFRLTGDTRDALLGDLRNPSFRNFYYFGH